MTKYKSNLERTFAHNFPGLTYEAQHLKYVVTHTYTPDWKVSENAAVETKGLFVGSDRAKHLHIRKQHPEFKVLLVFQDPKRKFSRLSKTTYADWCLKNDFDYCDAKNLEFIRKWVEKHR
jgi:hypothetical protein